MSYYSKIYTQAHCYKNQVINVYISFFKRMALFSSTILEIMSPGAVDCRLCLRNITIFPPWDQSTPYGCRRKHRGRGTVALQITDSKELVVTPPAS